MYYLHSHWEKLMLQICITGMTGNVSLDKDTGQWLESDTDRKCVTGHRHRAVEMRQEWQEMCHRTQGSGDETGMAGKVPQDTDTWQWRWRQECQETDRKGVTGHRHRAVEMRQNVWRWDWQERCHRTHRAVEMKLTQTGMTRTVSQDTDTGQCRKDDRNDWRWDRQEWWDETDRQEWLETRPTDRQEWQQYLVGVSPVPPPASKDFTQKSLKWSSKCFTWRKEC